MGMRWRAAFGPMRSLAFGSQQVTTVPRKRLCDIVQGYAVELVRRVHTELAHASLDELPAGIVLTGGSANLAGLADLVAEMSGPLAATRAGGNDQ